MNSHKIISRFLSRNSAGKRECHDIFKVMKGKKLQPRILYPARHSFSFDSKIKRLTDKQELREFSTNRQALQQMLKEFL